MTATRNQVKAWMQRNSENYENATELAEAANVALELPNGAMDDETHWIWDEALEAYGTKEWEKKAHRIIGKLCFDAHNKANPKNSNGIRPKKKKPYAVPALADELVQILGMSDEKEAEERAKAIFVKLAIIPESAND